MDFTYGTFSVFSRVEPADLTLLPAVGGYLLDVTLRFVPNNPPLGALVIEDMQLVICFGDARTHIGVAHPIRSAGSTGAIEVRNMLNGRQLDATVGFRLNLTRTALEEIEGYRNGGDAIFQLEVLGNIRGYESDGTEPAIRHPDDPWSAHILLNAGPSRVYGRYPASRNLSMTVGQSEWLKQLERSGYQKTILVEVGIPGEANLREAAKHLGEAQTAFAQGRYADAVARCRDALDSMIPPGDVRQRQLFRDASGEESRRKMTIEDAFGLAWASVRQITNASHHRNGAQCAFSRPMAKFVLGTTALALGLAGKELSLFIRRNEMPEAGAS